MFDLFTPSNVQNINLPYGMVVNMNNIACAAH